MMELGKVNGYLIKIKEELRKAEGKHHKFCDLVANPKTDWGRLETTLKEENEVNTPPYYGENILLEEIAEAFNAYQQGDKKQALQELAQCGAVILRIMEAIETEASDV